MSTKIYNTPRQLIKHLRSKGMNIEKGTEGSKVIKILKEENYYNIINGYDELFIDTANQKTNKHYKKGTTFKEVYALYNFDRNIRNIYLKCLLKVENKLKTVISSVFSSRYGYDNYLIISNFDTNPNLSPWNLERIARVNDLDIRNQTDKNKAISISKSERIQHLTDLFGSIQKDISKQLSKRNMCITHYMNQYGYIPLWVLVNILTFGKISDFYLNMKEKDKITVGQHFGIQFAELHKIMEHLSIARNYCAHGNRFYNLKFKKAIKLNSIPNVLSLKLNESNGNYLNGSKDNFSIAILLTRFLSKNEIKDFVRMMDNEFTSLSKELHTIKIEDVMDVMGFHKEWKNIVNVTAR